jgi:1-acyl-sn-glycerol-3-phosphate acyltransferase
MSKSEGGEGETRRRPAARRTSGEASDKPAQLNGAAAEQSQLNGAAAEPSPKRARARRFTSELGSAPQSAPAMYVASSARSKPRPTAARVQRPPPANASSAGAPSTGSSGAQHAPAVAASSGEAVALDRNDTRRESAADHVGSHASQTELSAEADAPQPRAPSLLSALTRRASAALSVRVEPVDEFGLDMAYELRLRPFFEAMCRSYLQIQVHGCEHIPAHGRALLVSNHSRALPWDGVMLRTALRLNHAAQRQPRWLVEDDQFHAPFLGTFVSRLGAVRACQENAERLLSREELVAVFPEGKADKRYSERHKLQRFGRGGYVKLALRTGAPVIPVAIVSCEEPFPLLQKVNALSKWVGLPLLALTPALPKLGPLGVPPVPSRWRIEIGEPIREIARQDADATSDDGLIHELNECVRGAVQQLVDQGLDRHD